MSEWRVLQPESADPYAEFPEIPSCLLQLLFHRGYKTPEAIESFLHPDYSRDVFDPYLFRDMAKACDRIYQAIEAQEKIVIHGDYDADGVSASTILKTVLTSLGAEVDVFLPHREKDGYGLNSHTIDDFAQQGQKLIITCDCGISNAAEVRQAKELGIDVIVTDHHQIPEQLPEALAIIHPRVEGESYPFKELAGGGVAFKLAQGLLRHQGNNLTEEQREAKEKWLLDLVALSSVADMVSMTGETRTLTKYGLIIMRKNLRLGLAALLRSARIEPKNITEETIGYQIAPRINAAGRMDHANAAYFLLMADNEQQADELAEGLNQANQERQRQTEQMTTQAKKQEINPDDSALFFFDQSWPLGLTGLVAGKLVRTYNKPCFVMGHDGDKIVGSGRGLEGLNILKAITEAKELLVAFGGHPQACGFRLLEANKAQFQQIVNSALAQQMQQVETLDELVIDAEIQLSEITWQVVDLLRGFGPYGIQNKEPIFLSRGVTLLGCQAVGKDSSHLKCKLMQGERALPAIGFGLMAKVADSGLPMDVTYTIGINEWNGNREIQLQIKDIKPT
jgi:single-stranded-DNA-specific exonuclease